MQKVTLSEARAQFQGSLVNVTLCLLIKNQELLLAIKRKKIGAGLWNGPGGKVEPGESVEEGMIREAKEELLVTPVDYTYVGLVEFYFPSDPAWNMQCSVYTSTKWDGVPTESEEMATPTWFVYAEIPWKKMWTSDFYWMPKVLNGEKIRAAILFDEQNEPEEYTVETVSIL